MKETKKPLTKRDILGPGVIIGREHDVIYALRDALKRIADVEPQPANSLAWDLVLMARDPVDDDIGDSAFGGKER